MKRYICILITSLLLCSSQSHAQRYDFTMSYPVSFPTGNLHDYISNTSFRGFNFEFNKQIKPEMTAGIEAGWNTFYKREDDGAYKTGSATITGVQYRYVNSSPILADVKFYPAISHPRLKPYFGAGMGVLHAERRTDFGLYEFTEDAWQFLIRPEAGLQLKTQSGIDPFIGLKYYIASSSNGLDGQSYLSLNIGFSIPSN